MKKVYIAAAVLAVLTGALLYVWLGNVEKSSEVEIQYETVIVAAQDIPAYTVITSDMLTSAQVPLGTAHEYAAISASAVVGLTTESDILTGEQILTKKLKVMGESSSGLSYVVPSGMRAVTIAVDDISGVNGLIRIGDYVDVVANLSTTYGSDPAAETPAEVSTTTVAAQNVLVVSLDSKLSDDGTQTGYSYMTLILSPEDAMRVIEGYRIGTLTVILRSSGDHSKNSEKPVVPDDLVAQTD